MTCEIRRIRSEEVEDALAMALEVFMEFEAPDYTAEGVETFKAFVSNEKIIRKYKDGSAPMYGAFDDGRIIGLIGMRSNKTHISLLFVRKEYHRKGVGTAMFRYLIDDLSERNLLFSELTVNSSPYGAPFYLKLGFVPQSEEVEADGIRYTPMKYVVAKGG